MSVFSDEELRYLLGEGRRLARLATVGRDGTPHVAPVGWSYNPDQDTIDIGGHSLEQTKKYRDVARSGRAAVVIDEVLPPWRPRGVEVRGWAEALEQPTTLIRVHPERIVSWGLHSDRLGDRNARTVGHKQSTMSTAGRASTTVTLAEHEWRPVDPSNPHGPRMATLWGDPASGPYGALLRVPAGFESPMHSHSSDERVVVIQGTSIHWTEDESRDSAQRLAAGSYMTMPAGVNHVSAGDPDQECIEFITQEGRFDFTLAPAAWDLPLPRVPPE